MPWTSLATVDVRNWDALVDEMRTLAEPVTLAITGQTILQIFGGNGWTRGAVDGNQRFRVSAMNGGTGDTAFHVSHIEDFYNLVGDIENRLSWNFTIWSMDPIVARYNTSGTPINPGVWHGSDGTKGPDDGRHITEARAALDKIAATVTNLRSDDGGT